MAGGIRGCFTLGGFLIELAPDGSTPLFPCALLFFCLAARDLLRCRGLSCGFLSFGLRSCSLGASFFLASGRLTLCLRLCCPRCLDTCRFLTNCQSTLRLQLRRSPLRVFDARRYFLASVLLPLRLESRCRQLRGLIAFGLNSCGLDTCRSFAKVSLAFHGLNSRGLNPRRLQLIRLFGQCSGLLPNVLASSIPC